MSRGPAQTHLPTLPCPPLTSHRVGIPDSPHLQIGLSGYEVHQRIWWPGLFHTRTLWGRASPADMRKRGFTKDHLTGREGYQEYTSSSFSGQRAVLSPEQLPSWGKSFQNLTQLTQSLVVLKMRADVPGFFTLPLTGPQSLPESTTSLGHEALLFISHPGVDG